MYAFSKFLTVYWNLTFIVCYASGLTAEDMGAWMQKCVDDGYTWFLECDYSRYDASISKEAMCQEHKVYTQCGCPNDAK